MWTVLFEIERDLQDCYPLRMPVTMDGEAVVEMPSLFQELEKWAPRVFTSPAVHKCIHISNHDDAASSSR